MTILQIFFGEENGETFSYRRVEQSARVKIEILSGGIHLFSTSQKEFDLIPCVPFPSIRERKDKRKNKREADRHTDREKNSHTSGHLSFLRLSSDVRTKAEQNKIK